MKNLLIAVMALVSLSSFASTDARFTISSITNSGRSYYHCDAVENMTEDMLEAFGAEVMSLRCRGGIDPVNPRWTTEARVRTSFETSSDSVIEFELRGRKNCHLAAQVLKGLREHFNITDLDMSRCSFRGNGSWRMSGTIEN